MNVMDWILLGVCVAAIAAAVLYLCLRPKREPRSVPVRTLVTGALCMAMAFVLSYIKLFSMPMGGSVTLCSMLPLFLYADRFGLKNGLLAGLAYGLLQFLQKPEIYHWAQVLLDYPLAFAALGLAGVLAGVKSPKVRAWTLPAGCVIGGAGRLLFSVCSGAVFFGEYAPAGMSPWLYSLTYNGAYLGVDIAVCVLLSIPLCVILQKNKLLQG